MALPMVTARTGQPAIIEVVGELISKPYIEITLAMMRRFGVTVVREGWQRFTVPGGDAARYVSPGTYAVEGDASSASYFLAAGAIAGGPVRVEGVGATRFRATCNSPMPWPGLAYESASRTMPSSPKRLPVAVCRPSTRHEPHPDAAMTLAVVALFAEGTTRLTNIGSWRVKETDRIAAMATELRKLGAKVEEGADWIAVTLRQR